MHSTPRTFAIDPARVTELRGAHRRLLIWQCVLAALAIVGIGLALLWELHLLTIVLASILLVIAVVGLVLSVRRWRVVQSLIGDGHGIALAVDDHGIVLAGVPSIPWSEVLGVATVDDRARTARLSRIPLMGAMGALAVRAGSSVLGASVLVRDGAAMQAACSSDDERRRIEVWGPHPSDGRRRGMVMLLLDAVMHERAAVEAGQALVAAARSRGIDSGEFTSQFDFMKFTGERTDPKWR